MLLILSAKIFIMDVWQSFKYSYDVDAYSKPPQTFQVERVLKIPLWSNWKVDHISNVPIILNNTSNPNTCKLTTYDNGF